MIHQAISKTVLMILITPALALFLLLTHTWEMDTTICQCPQTAAAYRLIGGWVAGREGVTR